MIEVVCSQCQKRYRTDSKYVGKRIKCGSCGHPIAIVEPGPPPMPVASATSDTTSAVSDSVPEIRTASLSPIASVLTGIELTWLGLLITSAIVLAPYPAAGQPWPTHIPTLFGSGPAVTKGIIAVFVALGIAGALLIAGWTNHWKMPPLVTRALQFGGFFMLTTAVIALIQLLHIYNLAELVTAHNTQFGRLGNYANPVVLPDSDPTWLVSRAVLILALAAFCGLMIAWTGLVRRGSLTATIWAASVCGIIFLLTVIYFTFGPGGQLIAALIYIAPAPYHHIMPLHTRIRILAGLLSWLILSTITIAILGMVLFDHSRERLKATPATYLRPWQIFQDSALIAVAGGVLAVAIIEQLANTTTLQPRPVTLGDVFQIHSNRM